MEMSDLNNGDPNIASSRMDSLAPSGMENLSDRDINIAVSTYENIVSQGYSHVVSRNMDNMSAGNIDTITARNIENYSSSNIESFSGSIENYETRSMENIATRGLDTYATRSIETLTGSIPNYATSSMNDATRGLENIAADRVHSIASSNIKNITARNMENIAATSRNVENISVRSLGNFVARSSQEMDTISSRSVENIARGMENITTSGIENIATNGMENIAASGMENIATSDMENIATSGMESITASGMENIATRGMENIATSGMENITTSGMENIAASGMERIATSGVETIAKQGMGSVSTNNVDSRTAGDNRTGESITTVDTVAVPQSVYEQEMQMAEVHPNQVSEEMSESRFAEKVDEIVQNLGDKIQDTYSETCGKSESSSQEQGEDMKSSATVATKFVHIIDDHSENFRHQLHQQWLKGQYCDLTLKVKDRDVKVHSCVVAAFSPVLCHLKRNMILSLPEVEHSSITPLIKMMYTGILCFDLADAPYVALAAKQLMLADVYAACEDYITQCQKSGLTVNDVNPNMVATGGVQVTVKKYGIEGFSTEYSEDKTAQVSGEEEQDPPRPVRRRGRPKRRPRKRYSKRGRPPKLKTDPIPVEPKVEDGTKTAGLEVPELMAEEKVVLSQQDEDEDVDVELEDNEDNDDNQDNEDNDDNADEEDEYVPGDDEKKATESRQRFWPHKKSTAVMKWLMSRRKDKVKPKHTKRDQAGRLKCPGCNATFPSSDELQNHIENSSEHSAFRCTHCGVAYIRKSNLTRHMRTVHSSSFHLKCRFCNISTKTERELRNHCLEMHSNNSPFECEHPGCNYRTYKYDFLRRHKQIHSEQKDYVCDKCGKTFSQQAGLLSHHRTCYHLQEYLCDVCGQAFNHYQSMKSHRRSIHYGERPFMCTDCGTRFSDHRNLKRHRRIHENVFPYACQICGQKYRHSNSLKAHMKKHSDVMSAEAAATSALISSYTPSDVEMGAQYSHPTPISHPLLPLNQLQEYYASACDKYVPMTSMSSVAPPGLPLSSNPITTSMNTTVTSVGLDTLADLCLSSSVV